MPGSPIKRARREASERDASPPVDPPPLPESGPYYESQDVVDFICLRLKAGCARSAASKKCGMGENTVQVWIDRARPTIDAIDRGDAVKEPAAPALVAAVRAFYKAEGWRACELQERAHLGDMTALHVLEHVDRANYGREQKVTVVDETPPEKRPEGRLATAMEKLVAARVAAVAAGTADHSK